MLFSAVLLPTVSSVPGTSLLIVTGMQTIGMPRAGYFLRLLCST